jgi:hypothetical protein
MGLGGQSHGLAALPPEKRPGTHFTRVWVGPRAGLEGCGKSHPTHWDSISVASRYSDYTMPVRTVSQRNRNNSGKYSGLWRHVGVKWVPTFRRTVVESIWNVMAHGDAREGMWRGNWRMEWVTSTLHTTSEHGVSSITTADAHTSAAIVGWTDAPTDLKKRVRFTERRNLVFECVPSHFKCSLPSSFGIRHSKRR